MESNEDPDDRRSADCFFRVSHYSFEPRNIQALALHTLSQIDSARAIYRRLVEDVVKLATLNPEPMTPEFFHLPENVRDRWRFRHYQLEDVQHILLLIGRVNNCVKALEEVLSEPKELASLRTKWNGWLRDACDFRNDWEHQEDRLVGETGTGAGLLIEGVDLPFGASYDFYNSAGPRSGRRVALNETFLPTLDGYTDELLAALESIAVERKPELQRLIEISRRSRRST